MYTTRHIGSGRFLICSTTPRRIYFCMSLAFQASPHSSPYSACFTVKVHATRRASIPTCFFPNITGSVARMLSNKNSGNKQLTKPEDILPTFIKQENLVSPSLLSAHPSTTCVSQETLRINTRFGPSTPHITLLSTAYKKDHNTLPESHLSPISSPSRLFVTRVSPLNKDWSSFTGHSFELG